MSAILCSALSSISCGLLCQPLTTCGNEYSYITVSLSLSLFMCVSLSHKHIITGLMLLIDSFCLFPVYGRMFIREVLMLRELIPEFFFLPDFLTNVNSKRKGEREMVSFYTGNT